MCELLELGNIFKQTFLMFQFIELCLYFGFTFNTKLANFQDGNTGKEVVLQPQILQL